MAPPTFSADAADPAMHLSEQARETGHSTFLALHQPDGSVRLMAYEGGTGALLYDFLTPADFAVFISDACQTGLEEWDARRRRALMRRA